MEAAGKIAAKVPPGIEKVGVFVEEPVEKILLTVAQAGLTAAQLHGDQYLEPGFLQQLKSIRDLKVFLVVPAEKISSPDWLKIAASGSAPFSLTQARPNCRGAREEYLIGSAAAPGIEAIGKNVNVVVAGGLTPRTSLKRSV